jgi:hypothetical protein
VQNFASKTIGAATNMMEQDAVVVTRIAGVPGSFVTLTLYSGNGSLQEDSGSMYITPAGVAEQADALLVVSNQNPASLPPVLVGDTVTRTATGRKFKIVAIDTRTTFIPHLEMKLKRGDIAFTQKP